MNKELLSLKPHRIWHYFVEILDIPRPSNKEEKIIEYLLKFGKSQNLETLKDEAGNVLIRKPATKGKENVPSIVLQSHIDMVCEKNNDKVHDFENDPIEAYIDGDWVKANGTTLGADDGIGVASQLAVLEANDIAHGPIECLFTVNEEQGLTGAFELKPDFLKSRILLNLDSEDEGQLFIGCAGGMDTSIELPFELTPTPSNSKAYKIDVKGLLGGHSGDEIHKRLGNANKILNRFLWESAKRFDLGLAYFEGGNLRNAIAREGHAIICIPERHKDDFEESVDLFREHIKTHFKLTDSKVTFLLDTTDLPEKVLTKDSRDKFLNAVYACPHGVIAFSAEIPDFVETSTNLAAIRTMNEYFKITTSQRSSVENQKWNAANMVNSVFSLAGARVKHSGSYPGWQPNPDSKIVARTVESYKKLFNTEPEVLAIHAGLECGLIGDKYEGMDMISFGPTIKGAHSPDERLHIESTQKYWDLLIHVLEGIN